MRDTKKGVRMNPYCQEQRAKGTIIIYSLLHLLSYTMGLPGAQRCRILITN